MQIRSKAYLHFISLRRLRRGVIPPQDHHAAAGTSPTLLFTAVVLALFLGSLEVDLHRTALESIGLVSTDTSVQLVFVSP